MPVPFFGVEIEPDENRTGSGCLVDEKEAAIIYKGFMFTCNSYLDCHFSLDSNRPKDKMHAKKYGFYIEKKSFLGNVNFEEDDLKEQLTLFAKTPIFYLSILLKDFKGKTPLDYAIDKNSPRIVEVLLNHVNKIEGFSLSRTLYKKFP